MPEGPKNLFNEPYEGPGERGFWVYPEGFIESFKNLEKNITEHKFGKKEFTERALKVIGTLAQEKAVEEDYNCTGFCGPEHIILVIDPEKDKKEIELILSKLGLDLNSFQNEITKEIEKRRAEMEISKKEEINENLKKFKELKCLPIDTHFQEVLILARELAKKTKGEITITHLFASIITESIEILIKEKRREIEERKGNIDIKEAAIGIKDDLKEIISPSVISAVLSKNTEVMKNIKEAIRKMKME